MHLSPIYFIVENRVLWAWILYSSPIMFAHDVCVGRL
jgi:hypothetical protein